MKISDYGITVHSKTGHIFTKIDINTITTPGYYGILYFDNDIGFFYLNDFGVSGDTDCGHQLQSLAQVLHFARTYRPASATTSATTPAPTSAMTPAPTPAPTPT